MRIGLTWTVLFLFVFALGAQNQDRKQQTSKIKQETTATPSAENTQEMDVTPSVDEEEASNENATPVENNNETSDKNAIGTYEKEVRNGNMQRSNSDRNKGYYVSEEEIAEMKRKKNASKPKED